jgi:predicted DCC family thiol-disulfide oxidoreductase YuxK
MALTVLYDDTCLLCLASRRRLARLDAFGRLRFVGVTDVSDAFAAGHRLDREALLEALHVVDGKGRVLRGFRALRRLLWVNPLTWPVALLFHLPGAVRIGEAAYRRVARRRHTGLPLPTKGGPG